MSRGPILNVSQGTIIELDGVWHHSVVFTGREHTTRCGLEDDSGDWNVLLAPANPDGPRCDECFPPVKADGGSCASDTYRNPYEERIAGETEVEWQCGVAASDHFDEEDFEYCPHEPETVELDEPAYVDENKKVHLPGWNHQCPECGNPHDFRVNGLGVFFG